MAPKPPITFAVEVPSEYAPHLKAAVLLLSEHIGTRLEQGAILQKELPLPAAAAARRSQAYVDGAIAVGYLRKAVCGAIVNANPDLR